MQSHTHYKTRLRTHTPVKQLNGHILLNMHVTDIYLECHIFGGHFIILAVNSTIVKSEFV